jgi:two-component system OmpR family response regulator
VSSAYRWKTAGFGKMSGIAPNPRFSGPAPISAARILVVDDDPFVRSVLAAALTDTGVAAVKFCESGPEALSQAAAFSPTLVLLDFAMPGMNGDVVWRKLRETLDPVPPVVFLTARQVDDLEADISDLDAAGVIAKPFDPLTVAADILRIAQGPADPVVSERLSEVAVQYRDSLGPMSQTMEQLHARLRAQGWHRETAQELLSKAHNLAGSAGLFGLSALGAAAEYAERLMLNAVKLDRVPSKSAMQELHTAIVALNVQCRMAAGNRPGA